MLRTLLIRYFEELKVNESDKGQVPLGAQTSGIPIGAAPMGCSSCLPQRS
jgi:hypothetical protein